MGLFSLFKSSRSMVVVDGMSLNESLGIKGSVPPRNQLQILRRLSRFAQREKLDMVVVLAGSPLNKAPAGEKFEDITVVYSKTPEAHAKCVVKTARSKGANAILVSGDAAIDKMAGNSLKTMRMSTFRKAFDVGGIESDTPERGDRDGRDGRSRPNRRRPQKQQKNKSETEMEQPPAELSDADAINELIDLVD